MRYYNYNPLYEYHHASFWPQGIVSSVIHIAFWVAIAWLIITLLKHFSHKNEATSCCSHGDCCEKNKYVEIVKERYAKGEIDKKQFDQLKKDLSDDEEQPELSEDSDKTTS